MVGAREGPTMTREWQAGDDLGLGLAVAAVALAAVGAAGMLAGAAESLAAWGLALAMIAGGIGVVALHAFPG